MHNRIKADELGLNSSTQLQYLQNRKNERERSRYAFPIKNKKEICTCLLLMMFVCFKHSVTLRELKNMSDLKCSPELDMECFYHLWKGEALGDVTKSNDYEASIVISSCEKETNSIKQLITDAEDMNITLRSVTIISGCTARISEDLPDYVTSFKSKWQYPAQHFIEWLGALIESSASRKLPEYYFNENHFILFYDAKLASKSRIHKVEMVLNTAKENGFGCFHLPQDELSYYHELQTLKNFENPSMVEVRNYKNF